MNRFIVNFIILLIMVVVTTNLAAQVDTLWTYENLTTQALWGVDTDSENNIIVAGADSDMAKISKMTTDGTFIWDHAFDGYYTVGGVKVDSEDNIWSVLSPYNTLVKLSSDGSTISSTIISTTADFTSKICITSEGDILTASSDISSGWLITRLNSDSEIIWSQLYSPADGDFYIPRQINVDNEGNILVVGETASEFNKGIVLKLDQDGNEIWNTQPINHTGAIQSVICDYENNIIVAGTNQLGCSNYIIKLDQDGEIIWTNESTGFGTSFGLSILSDGTLLTAGGSNEGTYEGDLRLSAYDSNGNNLWSNIMDLSNSEYYATMTVDSNNHIICAGNKYIGEEGFGFLVKYELEGAVFELPQNVNVEDEFGIISWDVPESSTPIGYNVYLDQILNNSVAELNYTFQNLTSGQTYLAGVSALYDDGESTIVEVEFTYSGTEAGEDYITAATLLGNYPNPFNPETIISFTAIENNQHTSISVYDIKGKLTKTLVDNYFVAGQHTVVWNGTDNNGDDVASGIYLYKMMSGNQVQTRKMILLK